MAHPYITVFCLLIGRSIRFQKYPPMTSYTTLPPTPLVVRLVVGSSDASRGKSAVMRSVWKRCELALSLLALSLLAFSLRGFL